MSELHKFIFDGLPVRGMLVRLTDAWQDILARRAANSETGAYPAPVRQLLGELTQRRKHDLVHFDTISLVPYRGAIRNCPTTLGHHNIESHLFVLAAGGSSRCVWREVR